MHTSHSLGKVFPLAANFAVALTLVLPLARAGAAELKQARVSQVVKDVKLLPGQAAPRPASVSDEVRDGTAVRTGSESRAELTFTDATLARLGANTIFSFNGGTRNLDLGGGAMLLRVPKNSGGAKINTAAITAAITGTTIMLEYHPDAYIKFIVLEGTGRIYRNNRIGESVLLHAGQMLIVNPNGEGLPEPVDVDIERILRTSLLINGFPPLPSNDLIAREINGQLSKKSEGELIETNLVIFGRGTAVTLLDPNYSAIIDQARATESNSPTPTSTMTPTPTPAGTPAKFGALPVITSPDPYVITGNTVIQTDPSITTNGQTDFGKIYRGPTADGTPSDYFFGSTSAFDTDSGFSAHFSEAGNLPVAAFKFSSLVLSGNPTISLVNNGATSLALISVGGITSGTGIATLTFAGLDSILLATQNGSITIGGNITFQNIPTLFLDARGLGSTLTFDGTVTGTTNLVLFSENNFQVTDSLTVAQTPPSGFTGGIFDTIIAGQAINVGCDLDLSIDSNGTDNDSGINVATSNGSITIGGLLGLTITAGTINNGANLNLNAGTDLSADSLALTLDLASAQTTVGNGANIVVIAGGDITIANDATFNLLHNGFGNIANVVQIFVLSGGDFTAGSITALVNNRDGGTITNGGSLVFDIGGALTTTGDTSLVVSGRDDGGGGGAFGSGAVISLSAGSISVGGLLTVGTGLSAGGDALQATDSIFSTGALAATGGLLLDIQNGGVDINGTVRGGAAITNDVSVSLTAASVTSGDALQLFINNLSGGDIGGNASVGFAATGPVTVQNATNFAVNNGTFQGDTLLSSIGSDATITVSAGSFSGGSLVTEIFNTDGASILGNADVTFTVNGALSTTGNSTFRIVNFDDGQGLGGGQINGNATINVNAASLSAAVLLARINNNGGTIGGDCTITFAINGALTTNSAIFSVLNNSGAIGGDIVIDVSAASVTTNGLFTSSISSLGGSALATNSISVAIAGALTAGDASFSIFDAPNAGPPGVDSISVTAGSIILTGSLGASINVSADTPVFLTDNVSISAAQNVTVGGGISVFGSLDAGGNITAGGTILIGGGNLIATGNITSTNGDIVLQSSADGIGALTAGGSINTHNLTAPSAQAGANITIGNTLGGPFSVVANTLIAGGAINLINVNSVTGFSSTFGPNGGFTPDPFILSANSLNVVGPSLSGPALAFNGSDGGSSDPGNGGSVTLNLTADRLTIGNTGDFTSIMANGGAFAVNGSSGGGNGGTVNITSSGVTVNDAGISADSGANPTGTPAGTGGTVNITSGGAVNVNSVIQTSGNGSGGSNSAQGGNINLTGSRATGVAINVSNTGQLLALLDNAAPGPGGKITILATGASSSVAVNGGVEADKGRVDIRHTGANGVVNLGDATGTSSVTLNGDIVKAGALGANGVLNVGGGSLSANSVLKLYAPSSNGMLNFVANVTLSSGTDAILAANTITIQPTVVVTIQGNGGRAQVFTNNPNYSGFGGNNRANGTFGGNGANNPLPLSQAPAFDGPPGG